MTQDFISTFKAQQRERWAHFAPLEAITTAPAARLVSYAGIGPTQRVLDVACGTGVVAITAARRGAIVTALDLTPTLLEHARENAAVAAVDVTWREGDAEALPFGDGAFDVVVSQYGHMFAPRPEVAIAEMLRVLKPGGVIAFSTWPPEQMVGRSFAVLARYMPPPPVAVPPPPLWGDPDVVRARLGTAVDGLEFERQQIMVPALSPAHYRVMLEKTGGPMVALTQFLEASDPARLAQFRAEYEALAAEFWADNVVRQEYLMSRARKRSA